MENEKKQFEEARKRYLETMKRKGELPEKYKKLFKKIESIEFGNYGVSCEVMLLISYVYEGNAINAFNTIFGLGFIKGQAQAKKQFEKENKHGTFI